MRATIAAALQHARLPWFLAVIAGAACIPALFLGFIADDWFQLAVLRGLPWPEFRLGWWDLFSLVPAGADGTRHIVDRGWLPWWLPSDARIVFFRPLAAFSHMLDFQLFGLTAWVAHLENLLLYAAIVALAAILYRRIMGSQMGGGAGGAAAGLAAFLYALDDGHSPSVGWIAGRNTLLASLFGIGALLAHDAWRRGRWRPGAWLAPLCLVLGLLSAEVGKG